MSPRQLVAGIHQILKTFESRGAAVAAIASYLPERSRRRAYPLYSGALDRWIVEWDRTAGRVVLCADGLWHNIWAESTGDHCRGCAERILNDPPGSYVLAKP